MKMAEIDVSPEGVAHIVKHLRESGVMSAIRAVELFEALSAERDELASKLVEATALAKHYEKCCDSYADENQKFHDRFTVAETALSAANAKLVAVETPWIERVAELRATISDLIGSHADTVAAHCAANAKLASARKNNDALERTADDLHKQLVAANAEIARLKAENDGLRKALKPWTVKPPTAGMFISPPPPQETTK
jgi:chromosome segregation ATPase